MATRYDPPDGYLHDGTRSWWDGSVRATCGKRFGPQTRWRPLPRTTCPGCLAAKRPHR